MRQISCSEAVREAIAQEMEQDGRVFLMGEDVGVYGGSYGVLKGLVERFGSERIRDTPISEAGFVGAAVGAAMTGTRPIVEIMYSDFLLTAMDQIVNQAAKMQYMFHGAFQLPLVIRAPSGSGTGAAAQHSQSLEALFTHIPGLKVVAPSTPYDLKGLLISSIRDTNPVLFLEQKTLYPCMGPVPREFYEIPLGKAKVCREGDDVAVITYGRMVHTALDAARILEERHGISVHVLDLRSLVPLDEEAVISAALRTRRVVILHEAARNGGFGGELAARIAGHGAVSSLEAPILRICGRDVPIPFSRTLEEAAVPSVEEVISRTAELCRHA